ncbi:heavy metal translocating P-type ATPase [Kordiimonas sp. SCSIO 12610]|uniref:heavy metal translocating P-type ATPase n=1 Tax=Kordiimonas sp. SCSIO 12610 TaxID=2829597 RepID=UPI00210DDD72|nr:heavy metal translocating P-type ATPase [Kordiimonas sp. SCSIO 12610]UTW55593.1 cadmium-translocating P-type ATPase [Kordiimonas sp. SCSIO 12610]
MATDTISNQQAHRYSGLKACKHCGTKIEGGDFCCSGCESAFAVLKANDVSEKPAIFSPFAVAHDDNNTLELNVEGVHCASCIRLIENALMEEDAVSMARVNMTTERLKFEWAGEIALADKYAQKVIDLGYNLKPLAQEQTQHNDNSEKRLLKAIAIAGFAAGNLMLLSVGLWTSTTEIMGAATKDFLHWISATIALPAVIYSGMPFFKSAAKVIRAGHTNMDVPISLAVILASVMSISETLRSGDHVYFDSAAMLLFFLLIGRYLDIRAKGKARQSASKLLSRLSGTALVKERDGNFRDVPLRDLQAGMNILVSAGENIPADGTVVNGISQIDMSLITGETVPETVNVDARVFAGTVNIDAPIEIAVTKANDKSLLSEIVKMMEVAEQGSAKYVRLADRAASLYTPVVHTFGLLTFIGWWLLAGSEWQVALLHAVTVLIITCPCALGLAVPVVQVLASGRLMRKGILLKSGDALERLANIDAIVFDKTGTLTLGHPELTSKFHENETHRLAASIAAASKHPLSRALLRSYDGALLDLKGEVREIPGKGLEYSYEGQTVRLGKQSWCAPDVSYSETNVYGLELWFTEEGKSPVRFIFEDQPRADAKDVVETIHKLGIATHLVSGDREGIAAKMATELGIDTAYGQVSPIEKTQYIQKLKDAGLKVAMIGDGLNDAPALASADVSLSPSSAVDISQNTADIVFQGNELAPIIEAIRVAKFSTKLVHQNFGLAVLYNLVAIPLAILGYVTPLVAAIAMSGSSLVVIFNAFRLNLMRAYKGK